MDSKIWLRAFGIGLAYYACAWIGVHGTITDEGIAIIWLPNAVLLAAFLLHPPRQWAPIALAAVAAEVAADVPNFPVWAAVAFGLVNLIEASLAACLIRISIEGRFDFNRLRSAALFLLFGPLIASISAGFLGAAIYVFLSDTNSSYLALWRLWWFGDALGLLLLTPLIMTMWRHRQTGGWTPLSWSRGGELLTIWLLIFIFGIMAFPTTMEPSSTFHFTPILLVPLGVWAALRFGVLGATMAVNLVAALAVVPLVRGRSPYPYATPLEVVWLTQEYLVVFAIISIGLAILMHETSRLQVLATTDFLTGFANRRHFHELCQRELRRSARDRETASVIVFDIDNFKSINDEHGHDFGDELLRRIETPVRRSTRPCDLSARLGGDEFAIFLPATDQEQALKVAERLREETSRLVILHGGKAARPTASFGVVQWDGQGDLRELLVRADATLYRAKRSGRNQVAG